MLDKLSIEDIKASVTELMAGGVDTVRKKSRIWSLFSFLILLTQCVCVSDLYNTAVDVVWTSQAPQPPGGAEGRGGCSSGYSPGRHAGDAEQDSFG